MQHNQHNRTVLR